MAEIAILKCFRSLTERKRKQGTRHSIQLCLPLFALAVASGNQGI